MESKITVPIEIDKNATAENMSFVGNVRDCENVRMA